MLEPKIFLADENATMAFGQSLQQVMCAAMARDKSNFCVYLNGDLGAGKTTTIRAFLAALGYEGRVKSPTYTLVESYKFVDFSVHHFDLYRLNDSEELDLIGVRDYFVDNTICFVEWPQKGAGVLAPSELNINLEYSAEGRNCSVSSTRLSDAELQQLVRI